MGSKTRSWARFVRRALSASALGWLALSWGCSGSIGDVDPPAASDADAMAVTDGSASEDGVAKEDSGPSGDAGASTDGSGEAEIAQDTTVDCEPEPSRSGPEGRPLYHFTPPVAWMNDPAGLSFLAGEYHLFYQRDPNEVFLADVRWGHAVSPDLVHWSDLPDALAPDATLGVPFTGSAVVDHGNTSGLCGGEQDCLVALFTHANGAAGAQQQSVAVSTDRGRTFAAYDKNPVIGEIGEPDFRDPAVRWHAATSRWVMAVGAKDRVLFYTSPNLLVWTSSGEFGLPSGAPKGAVECPALFPLPAPDGDEVWVLALGVTPGLLQAAPTRYWIGSFDGEKFTAASRPEGLAFDGPDFYAAQVFANVPGGRTLWLGWMSQWSYAMMTPTDGYRGAQSVPRELSIVATPGGMRLAQKPVVELAALESACPRLEADALTVDGVLPLLTEAGDAFVLRASLAPSATGRLGFNLMAGVNEETTVGYDADTGVVFLDRTSSGDITFSPDFAGRYEVAIAPVAGRVALTIYVDRTSVEVFAGDGSAVITASIYPIEVAHGLSAFSEGGTGVLHAVEVRALERSIRAD